MKFGEKSAMKKPFIVNPKFKQKSLEIATKIEDYPAIIRL